MIPTPHRSCAEANLNPQRISIHAWGEFRVELFGFRLFQQLGNDSSRLLEYGVVRPFALFSERDLIVGDTLFETLVSILVT